MVSLCVCECAYVCVHTHTCVSCVLVCLFIFKRERERGCSVSWMGGARKELIGVGGGKHDKNI